MLKKLRDGQLSLLGEKQIEQVHRETLRVLEQVGILTDSEKILEIFDGAGALIDGKKKRIKIPAKLVEEALGKAPSTVILRGRDSKKDIFLEDSRVYFGIGGTPVPFYRDPQTGEVRRPTKKDVADVARVGDALPGISFVMSLASAYDVPPEVEYLHELEVKYNNTGKPIVHPLPGAKIARKALDMAAAVAGGKEELFKRPILTLYSESVSPLFLSKHNEDLIEFAKVGAPVIFAGSPMGGVTSPATLIGTFLVSNAETLTGITLAQLVRPGTPVIYGPHTTVMDMKTLVAEYGAMETAMGRVLTGQMARYYKLPTFGQGGCTDSKLPDAQAAAEAAITALLSALGGNNLIQCVGTMASGSYGSLEMAVIGNEIIGMINRILRGVEVSEDTLAFEVIDKVGPGGNFLSQKHTLKFFKQEFYIPQLFNKMPWETWLKSGGKRIEDLAAEKTREILNTHRPDPLPQITQQKLAQILKEAEEELVVS